MRLANNRHKRTIDLIVLLLLKSIFTPHSHFAFLLLLFSDKRAFFGRSHIFLCCACFRSRRVGSSEGRGEMFMSENSQLFSRHFYQFEWCCCTSSIPPAILWKKEMKRKRSGLSIFLSNFIRALAKLFKAFIKNVLNVDVVAKVGARLALAFGQ